MCDVTGKGAKKAAKAAEHTTGSGDATDSKEEPPEGATACTIATRESWQSDSADDDDDDFFEEDDMFSRLEESRAKLETELGCDTFLKAYKTVQVRTGQYFVVGVAIV